MLCSFLFFHLCLFLVTETAGLQCPKTVNCCPANDQWCGCQREDIVICPSSCSTKTCYGDTTDGWTEKGCGGAKNPNGCTITDRGDCCLFAGCRQCICRTNMCNKKLERCADITEDKCNNTLHLPSPCTDPNPPPSPCRPEEQPKSSEVKS